MAYIDLLDRLPKWAKIVLAIPCLSLSWVVYRFIKAIKIRKNGHINSSLILRGILMLVLCEISWIFEITSIATTGHIFLGND